MAAENFDKRPWRREILKGIRFVDVTAGSNKKFVPKYRGPYAIKKGLPTDCYVVGDIDGCQVTQNPYEGIIEAKNMCF